jgi:2,4-dienoyl-CoA reductase-like NADH-dependent reductase (Old Yellow Enzyme family)
MDGLSRFTLAVLDIVTAAYQQQFPDPVAARLKALQQRLTDVHQLLTTYKYQLDNAQETLLRKEEKAIVDELTVEELSFEQLKAEVERMKSGQEIARSAEQRQLIQEAYARRAEERQTRPVRVRKNFYVPYAPAIAAP